MKVFTKGRVAKICKVQLPTVTRWIETCRLKSYRIPGSKKDRIPRETLINFLKEHRHSLGVLLKILIISQDSSLTKFLSRHFTTQTTEAEDNLVPDLQPGCVIIDFSIGTLDALQECEKARRELPDAIVIALVPKDIDVAVSVDHVNKCMMLPVDHQVLYRTINDLTSLPDPV